ncbi:TPA: hypothetical protein ACOJ4M_002184, partial [Streptococcus pneumoniae]
MLAALIFYLTKEVIIPFLKVISKINGRKKVIYWLLTILGLWMITLTPIFENIVGAILKVDGAGRGSDSLTIRAIGRQLYWEQLNETTSKLLFGTGYPNYNYALAFQRTGFSSNIFLTDNGFMTH